MRGKVGWGVGGTRVWRYGRKQSSLHLSPSVLCLVRCKESAGGQLKSAARSQEGETGRQPRLGRARQWERRAGAQPAVAVGLQTEAGCGCAADARRSAAGWRPAAARCALRCDALCVYAFLASSAFSAATSAASEMASASAFLVNSSWAAAKRQSRSCRQGSGRAGQGDGSEGGGGHTGAQRGRGRRVQHSRRGCERADGGAPKQPNPTQPHPTPLRCAHNSARPSCARTLAANSHRQTTASRMRPR